MLIKLFKTNIIYAIGSVANSAAILLIVPFLVNSLSQDEYGVWSIYEIVNTLLLILIGAGMDLGLMREYWFKDNDQERNQLCGTVLLAVFVWGLILFVFLFTGYWLIQTAPIFSILKLDNYSTRSLVIVYFIGFFEVIFSILLAIYRIREEATLYVFLSFGRMILFLGCAILGVKITSNIDGALLGRLFAAVIGIVMAIIFIRRCISFTFDKALFRKVISYGLPFIPANLSGYILMNSDRYFLSATSSLGVVAVYSFVYKIASGFDVLINRPFAIDWAARRYRIALHEDAPKKYAEILILYLLYGSLGVLGLTVLAPLIYQLIAPAAYLEGIKILPVLLGGIFVYGISYPVNVGLIIKDKTTTNAKIAMFSAAFCLAIEYWLIPRYGIYGAAWSTLLSYLVWTIGITIFSLKIYPIPYQYPRIFGVFMIFIVGFIGIEWIPQIIGVESNLVISFLANLFWIGLLYGFTGYKVYRRALSRIGN